MNPFPPELDRELEAFIRWLAIMPQHFKSYRAHPEAIIRTSRLSPGAAEWLRDAGVKSVIDAVFHKLDEICDDPATLQRSDFTRDRSIGGYGGVIKNQ